MIEETWLTIWRHVRTKKTLHASHEIVAKTTFSFLCMCILWCKLEPNKILNWILKEHRVQNKMIRVQSTIVQKKKNTPQLYICVSHCCHHRHRHHSTLFLFSCSEDCFSCREKLKKESNYLLEEAFQLGHFHTAISERQVKSQESCLSLLLISKGLQRGLEHDSLFCGNKRAKKR